MLKTLGKIENRLLVFGGPYSNLAATEAMRSIADEKKISPEHIICTGDLVAYCAEPRQTVDLIRDWGIHVVMGNCEESLAWQALDCGCGFEAGTSCSTLSITWYEYASRHIKPEIRHWMNDLPRSIEFQMKNNRFKVVHGSVSSINQFVFPSTPTEIKRSEFSRVDVECLIGGHSGIPFGQNIDNRFWLNAGAIGLPANDGSSDGWYMFLEPEETGILVSWHRLSYDAKRSPDSTFEAGMNEYARALVNGLWPSMDVLPSDERAKQGNRLVVRPLVLSPIKIESV